jgi:xylulokinase
MVSSFLASLFLAHFAPIEVADASGMNLMSLSSRKWDTNLLHVVSGGNADDLRSKLSGTSGDVGPALGGEVLGTIGKWWVERYKFSEGESQNVDLISSM